MKTLSFVKYSGNGNDFVILEDPQFRLESSMIERLCDRNFGVGADGVLVLTPAEGFDGRMRIFNADGGEAEMCGNGLRCLVTYLNDKALTPKDTYSIKTMNGIYLVKKQGNQFAIEMSEIKDHNLHDLSDFTDFDRAFFVNTGVPHLVFLTKEVKKIDIKKTAPFYRFHPKFPNGTNVSFVQVKDNEQAAYVRTFERGVEDETFSCGTGLTAAGLALSAWFGWKNEIKLETKGGEQKVLISEKIYYSGQVIKCFEGTINL